MKRIVRYFIPDTLPDDADIQRKANVSIIIWLIIAYFNLSYALISYFIGYSGGVISQIPLFFITVV